MYFKNEETLSSSALSITADLLFLLLANVLFYLILSAFYSPYTVPMISLYSNEFFLLFRGFMTGNRIGPLLYLIYSSFVVLFSTNCFI